jgi:ketosteroid isomerase-like protein
MQRWFRSAAGLGLLLAVTPVWGAAQMEGAPEVHRTLDAFHRAASDADFDAYMGLFADDAVFLGTDATERWSRAEFAEYVAAAFDRGRGWTYRPTARWVSVSTDGNTAWFDERLTNANYGETRGSGVLVQERGDWKIAQYNLTIPIPNALAREVVARIREGGGG